MEQLSQELSDKKAVLDDAIRELSDLRSEKESLSIQLEEKARQLNSLKQTISSEQAEKESVLQNNLVVS